MGPSPSTVSATLSFIVPQSWPETEKPYELLYQPTDGLRVSNYRTRHVENIKVHDVGDKKGKTSLDREGWVVAHLPSALSWKDFHDEMKLKSIYTQEVRKHLIETLGVRAVYFHECVVRKKDSP